MTNKKSKNVAVRTQVEALDRRCQSLEKEIELLLHRDRADKVLARIAALEEHNPK